MHRRAREAPMTAHKAQAVMTGRRPGQHVQRSCEAGLERSFPAPSGLDFSGVQPWHDGGYPHAETIERALGVALPGRAFIDPGACRGKGVEAFTDNLTTRFASPTPSLKVAAHEAAHVLQHGKLTRDAGLGPETHAEAVAHRITRGGEARSLLTSAGSDVAPAERSYVEIPLATQSPTRWNASMDLRVAEDGSMAVGQATNLHHFWADPAMIAQSNAVLAARRSVIRLTPQSETLTGSLRGGAPHTLTKVLPENLANSTSGETMNLWADCGRSARDVTGAGQGTGGGEMEGVYSDRQSPWYSSIPILGPILNLIFGGPTTSTRRTSPAGDPEDMKREIFNQRLGGSGDEGLDRYSAMSAADRERFDQETGINRFAAPGTGEAYTMSTGGNPVPGHRTWNFHWAGVVMLGGVDRVTLENYAIRGQPAAVNADWEFQMYGPASRPGQTFHEQHRDTGTHGDAPTTIRAAPR